MLNSPWSVPRLPTLLDLKIFLFGTSNRLDQLHQRKQTMAGPVRQPINVDSLSNYIEKNVPEIKLPISVKQVPIRKQFFPSRCRTYHFDSLALDNQTLHISSRQLTARDMSFARSLQENCFRRRPIRSNESIASFMPWKTQMYRCPKPTACARTRAY